MFIISSCGSVKFSTEIEKQRNIEIMQARLSAMPFSRIGRIEIDFNLIDNQRKNNKDTSSIKEK
jgi:hypothetical protein